MADFVGGMCTGAGDGGSACTAFFTNANMALIMDNIISAVGKHGFCIEAQSRQQLLLLMRTVWTRYGATEGLDDLNGRVIQEAADIILTNIEMQAIAHRYLDTNPVPMPHGTNTNVRGTKLA